MTELLGTGLHFQGSAGRIDPECLYPNLEAFPLSNHRVLVTAGASGIGREIVRAFAGRGATIFVCDIDAKGLGALSHEVVGLKTGTCDISSRKDVERMVGEAVQALGGLDVLVNNAGVSGPTTPVGEMDPDEWEKVMQVDLTGTFNVTRLSIPHLGRGGVVASHLPSISGA